MKKLIIIIIVLGALGGGYYKLSTTRLNFSFARGESVTVSRGDLTIPITATGPIGPLSRHQIKSEASGEVIEINFQPGDLIRKGDLLIRLNKDDEQRSVDRANSDVKRAKAAYDSAGIKVERLKTVGLKLAGLKIEQIQPRVDHAKFNFEKIDALFAEDRSSKDELERVRASYRELSASLEAAKAERDDTKVAIDVAHQDVLLAEAVYEQAETTLADAEERLAETDIHCPVNGMVVALDTQVGEVIQGGKTTFTGGTVLAVVADTSKLYVRAEVDEADIGAVCDLAQEGARPGHAASFNGDVPFAVATPVKIRVESFHDEEFTGAIERIHPEPNSSVSSVVTYQVDILLTSDNRDKLLAGMQADVEFTAQSVENVVLVPHEAIHRNDFDELGVYIPVKGDTADKSKKRFVKCRFGLDNGMWAEVMEGLDDGAEVYTKLPAMTGQGDDD